MEQDQIEIVKEAELPQVTNWEGTRLSLYQGFWLSPLTLPGLVPLHKHFRAQDSDVILATFPKSGTTWLKALAFSIINRTHYHNKTHPLLSSNPHDLVLFLELLYRNNPSPILDHPHHPVRRIFGTHLPYKLLPHCITNARIVYICRNPLDQFISLYHFNLKILLQNQTLQQHDHAGSGYYGSEFRVQGSELFEEAFDFFCRGIQRSGPSLDHHLEYWKASLERPDEVLFLKYEDVKDDTLGCTRRVAEFLGCPFSQEEEDRGVVDDIVRLCSFESMRDLDVNKIGRYEGAGFGFDNSFFFRKGEVGDWVNYLTPPMVERVHKLMEEKFAGSGLTFN